MPRISEIDPAHAPEAIQKIIADHVADGHALTAEKRTLLHNAAAFNTGAFQALLSGGTFCFYCKGRFLFFAEGAAH